MVLKTCAGVERKSLLQTLEAQRIVRLELEHISNYADFAEAGHLSRVQSICWVLACRASTTQYKEDISGEQAINIAFASALHDIGKVGIPSKIIDKPGRLTKVEFDIMKEHTHIGVDIINRVAKNIKKCQYLKTAKNIAIYHHEKWDGTGYPHGKAGKDIPISARVCAIADVYDALREKRAYKKAFTHEEAIEIMKNERGTHFDPVLLDVFLEYSKDMEISFRNKKEISINELMLAVK